VDITGRLLLATRKGYDISRSKFNLFEEYKVTFDWSHLIVAVIFYFFGIFMGRSLE
jgi:hypothetical protein